MLGNNNVLSLIQIEQMDTKLTTILEAGVGLFWILFCSRLSATVLAG
jgi:hypothetical protein